MDPTRNRFDTQNRVVRFGSHSILHSIKELSRRSRRLLTQMLHITLELSRRQIGIDPIVLQLTRMPKRATRFGLGRFSRLPNTNDPPRQKLRHSLPEHVLVLVDQQLAELVLQELLELGRVVLPELGSDLEDYDLRLGLGQELLDVTDDDIDAVRCEDPMADSAIFLDSDIQDPGPSNELLVYG